MDVNNRFQNLGANLALLGVAVIWGMNFVAMKHVIGQVGPLKMLLLRVFVAAAIFGLILVSRRALIPRFTRDEWRLLFLVGLFGVVSNQLFISIGTSYLSAAIASMLATSTPVFMAILSRFVLKESLTQRKIIGIVTAFCGFLIVLLFGSGEAEFSVDNTLGGLITILAPLSWTISTLLSTRLMLRYDPTAITGLSTVIASLVLLPLLAAQASIVDDMLAFGATEWAAVFVSSVLSIVVAYTVWYRALRRLEPTQVAVYVYLVPFFGVIFAWLLLNERVTPFVVLGGATILGGVIVTNSSRRPAAVPLDGNLPEPAREHGTEIREIERGGSVQ